MEFPDRSNSDTRWRFQILFRVNLPRNRDPKVVLCVLLILIITLITYYTSLFVLISKFQVTVGQIPVSRDPVQ